MNSQEVAEIIKANDKGQRIQRKSERHITWVTIKERIPLNELLKEMSEGVEFRIKPKDLVEESLTFGGKPIRIDIPIKNNNCANWNEHGNIYNNTGIELPCGYGQLSFIKKIVDLHNETFGNLEALLNNGRDITIGNHHCSIDELRQIIRAFEKHTKKIIGVYSERDFKLTIE
jgi:hypothetical protein